MRRTVKIIKIVLLCLLGMAVLAFGVFMLSVDALFDDMRERTYYEYSFDIPDSENQLVIKEWFAFRSSGIEFYLKTDKKEKLLDSVTTNEYNDKDFAFVWSEDGRSVEVTYGFDRDIRKTITLTLE
ncbi:MAG: hypothetical protein IJ416_02725 [Ruminiclostridium sp.]|nr:hypothetical protein [Ruminiclostridium sp.]